MREKQRSHDATDRQRVRVDVPGAGSVRQEPPADPHWGSILLWALVPVVAVFALSFPALAVATIAGMALGVGSSRILHAVKQSEYFRTSDDSTTAVLETAQRPN